MITMDKERWNNLKETDLYAEKFLRTLEKRNDKATIVGLSGDLGSGKTTLTKALAKSLGIEGEIVSPTFVIAKFYDIPSDPRWKQLVHVDAYRIESVEEVRPLRLTQTFADPENLVIVEWPEQLGSFFPDDAVRLNLRFIDEVTREIERVS